MSNRKFEPEDANPKSNHEFMNKSLLKIGNINPKPIQTLDSTTDQPGKVFIQRDQIHRPIMAFTESHKSLLQIFTKHIEISSLSKIQEKIILAHKDSTLGKAYQNLICQKCNFIKLKAKLRCGHSRCYSCLKSNLIKLQNDPNFKNAKSIACKKCFSLPDIQEIKQITGHNSSFNFEYPELYKKCGYCRRDLNLYTEFFFELKCFHLCKHCYVDQLYMGIYNCMVCQQKFKNLELTKQREDICSICNSKKNYFSECLKCYDEKNLLCYSCQHTSYIQNNRDVLTSRIEGKDFLIPFKKYINKQCPVCHLIVNLDEVLVCHTCGNFICESCFNCNPQCKLCFNDFKRN